MKKLLLSLAAVSALAATTVPAAAAPGQNINQQQQAIERRIDVGVRNHSLTRPEAVRLRAELRQIAVLETRYRRGGLSQWERRDLDRKLDLLSAKVRVERHDRQDRRYGYGYGRH